MTKFHRAGFGATAFGALAATAVLAAPSANALVTGISVSGDKFCTGKTYTVTVDVTVTSFLFDVTLTDGSTEVGKAKPSNGKATFSWTPTTTGSHTLKAVQEVISSKTTTVSVVDCTPTGGGTGSFDGNPFASILSSLSAK
ncbi:Ig-like domain repeat protein [Nocardia yamanashiensis]|uniref:Ig-like domain repeat protein n=1 Tax=Nocardia yamanashiensis TaxID=209247 RepID=UPI00082F763E|nr:Ig-like domain repeat protein [Nocardia yamanashiensis]